MPQAKLGAYAGYVSRLFTDLANVIARIANGYGGGHRTRITRTIGDDKMTWTLEPTATMRYRDELAAIFNVHRPIRLTTTSLTLSGVIWT